MQRYGVIDNKRKREIVLLRGSGCAYKRCAFCDYYLDSDVDCAANYALNAEVLAKVGGIYGELEVINSGSVFKLDGDTLREIARVCRDKDIKVLHFEAHYLYRNRIAKFKERFKDFDVKFRLGLETFDFDFRENVLKKGIFERSADVIAEYFDEVNLLFGISGQNVESMQNDLELALKYFERAYVNIMCGNSTEIKPDEKVVEDFVKYIYPKYADDERVDILLKNTDFGVG